MWRRAAGKIWRLMPRWGRRGLIRLTQPSFTVSAGVVVVNDAGQILLLNHILRPASGWGVPGGFLDSNEHPSETARREVLEETGLELTDVELVTFRTINHHVEFWYRGRAIGEPLVNTKEILEARWFRFEDIPPEMSRKEVRLIEQALRIGEKQVI
jgi:8-oxo-dGTP diphosphatase